MNAEQVIVKINFLFAFILVIASSSCYTPRFYTPNSNPTPLFKTSGDIHVNGSSNCINKGDLTLGYALTNGIAAYAAFGGSSERTSTGFFRADIAYKSIGYFRNYGLGYYLNEGQSQRFRFETFADLTFGGYKIIKYPAYDEYYNQLGNTAYLYGKYRKIGLLSNIAYSNRSQNFHYGYTFRFSNIDFYGFRYEEESRLGIEKSRLTNKPNYFLYEHGIFCRYGRKVAFQCQFSLYHGIGGSEDNDAVQKLNGALMIGFLINTNFYNRTVRERESNENRVSPVSQ